MKVGAFRLLSAFICSSRIGECHYTTSEGKSSSVRDLDTLQGDSSLDTVGEMQEEVGCPFAPCVQ